MQIRHTLVTFLKRIDSINHRSLTVAALFLEAVIAFGDYITGPMAPFNHFYLIPITLAAYYLSASWTYAITLLAAIAGIPVFLEYIGSFELMPLCLDFISKIIVYFFLAFLIRELRQLMNELEELATEDPLTKAYSGRYFFEFGTAEIARAQRSRKPFSLAFIDLDNFKEVNDTQGHRRGDTLLIVIANTIKGNLREGDILGRLGGDEFAILLTQTDCEQAGLILERMLDNLFSAIQSYKTRVTFSIGVVTYTGDKPASIEELVTLADKAMYSIKKSTKNAVQFIEV